MTKSFTVKDNILYGGDVPFSLTGNCGSVGEFLLQRLKLYEDKVYLIDAITGHEYTRKWIYEKVIRLVYILKYFGVKEGTVVGICSENRIEFLITLEATLVLGATLTPLNFTYTKRELHYAVNLSRPKIMFVSKGVLSKIIPVAKSNEFIKDVIAFDEDTSIAEFKVKFFTQLLNDKKIESYPDFKPPIIDRNENVALIIYSSGTTGLPKGVQLSQKNIMTALDHLSLEGMENTPGNTFISVIPWFHMFGCISLIKQSCNDSRFVILPKFDENIFLKSIEKYKVTIAIIVPPLMVFLAKHPIVDQYDFSSLLCLICGAATLRKETDEAVRKRIGVPSIRQGYGLSETTAAVVAQSNNISPPGSVGTLRPGIWAKVIDTKTGKALGQNEHGELCFKGDLIMKGYIGDDIATSSIIKDGWLHSGDVGYYDQNFDFFIVDRMKELIKYKAFQVPPAEIESLLLTNPNIKDAAVIGKPDESAGELPFAFVVKQPGAKLTVKEVIKFVNDSASPAKKLRGGVQFVDEIPKNASGKILRRVLRDMLNKTNSKL